MWIYIHTSGCEVTAVSPTFATFEGAVEDLLENLNEGRDYVEDHIKDADLEWVPDDAGPDQIHADFNDGYITVVKLGAST